MELEFSQHFFEKAANIKFHENSSTGIRVFHAEERTGVHDEANSCFSQFYQRA